MELVLPGIGLVFWMSLVFILLLVLLKKFAWKPILGALKEREGEIMSSLMMAKETKMQMEQLKAENEKLLVEARQERDAILVQANKAKDQIITDAKAKAQHEADRIVENSRMIIESEKRAAINEIKNQVAELSIAIAEKVLVAELSDKKKQSELVDKQLSQLNFN
jgi:F-type H+-transporting ATPase subunit b